jgi:hypothetical protein
VNNLTFFLPPLLNRNSSSTHKFQTRNKNTILLSTCHWCWCYQWWKILSHIVWLYFLFSSSTSTPKTLSEFHSIVEDKLSYTRVSRRYWFCGKLKIFTNEQWKEFWIASTSRGQWNRRNKYEDVDVQWSQVIMNSIQDHYWICYKISSFPRAVFFIDSSFHFCFFCSLNCHCAPFTRVSCGWNANITFNYVLRSIVPFRYSQLLSFVAFVTFLLN